MTDPTGTGRPSLVSHVSVGSNDLHRAGLFYDAVLAAIGGRRLMEHGVGIGYGRTFPEFWIARAQDGRRAEVGNGTHVCFNAPNEKAVMDFHAAGLAAGGFDDGAPGRRPQYAPGYYAAFLRDPDGNKVEAMCWIAPPDADALPSEA